MKVHAKNFRRLFPYFTLLTRSRKALPTTSDYKAKPILALHPVACEGVGHLCHISRAAEES